VNVLRDAMAVDSLTGAVSILERPAGRCMLRRMREIADTDCAGFAGGALGRGADAAVSRIRIELPYHLRTLAEVRGEVELEVTGAVTQRSILDALETKYPVLRGTIRDHGRTKGGRSAFFRVFGGLVARIGGCAAARSCGLRQRTAPDRGGDCRGLDRATRSPNLNARIGVCGVGPLARVGSCIACRISGLFRSLPVFERVNGSIGIGLGESWMLKEMRYSRADLSRRMPDTGWLVWTG